MRKVHRDPPEFTVRAVLNRQTDAFSLASLGLGVLTEDLRRFAPECASMTAAEVEEGVRTWLANQRTLEKEGACVACGHSLEGARYVEADHAPSCWGLRLRRGEAI